MNPGWSFGPRDSGVQLDDAVVGLVHPEQFEIVERRGCDPAPVDITTPEGRLRLRSFVWPFHVDRHIRLGRALEIAEREPPVVDKAAAGE